MTTNAAKRLPAKPNQLAWGARVSTEFVQTLLAMCRRLGWSTLHACWLMACMAFESGTTFSPSVRNGAGSGAVGLIQFMRTTAMGLGTTVDELAAMTAVGQLAYVEKYFAPYAHRIHTLSDMYMAILLPKYIGQPEDAVLFSGGVAYRQNSGLDANRDGKVTKAEATARVADMLKRGMQPGVFATYEAAT
jgi:hypothetical protein